MAKTKVVGPPPQPDPPGTAAVKAAKLKLSTEALPRPMYPYLRPPPAPEQQHVCCLLMIREEGIPVRRRIGWTEVQLLAAVLEDLRGFDPEASLEDWAKKAGYDPNPVHGPWDTQCHHAALLDLYRRAERALQGTALWKRPKTVPKSVPDPLAALELPKTLCKSPQEPVAAPEVPAATKRQIVAPVAPVLDPTPLPMDLFA